MTLMMMTMRTCNNGNTEYHYANCNNNNAGNEDEENKKDNTKNNNSKHFVAYQVSCLNGLLTCFTYCSENTPLLFLHAMSSTE